MSKAQGRREAARRFGLTEPPTTDAEEKPRRRASDGRAEAARRFGTKKATTKRSNT